MTMLDRMRRHKTWLKWSLAVVVVAFVAVYIPSFLKSPRLDGASNYGSPPLEAARLARQEGVPLYIYGVGITSPRDIIVASVLTQEIAFVKDELPVTVRVRGQGLKGEQAKLVLKPDYPHLCLPL